MIAVSLCPGLPLLQALSHLLVHLVLTNHHETGALLQEEGNKHTGQSGSLWIISERGRSLDLNSSDSKIATWPLHCGKANAFPAGSRFKTYTQGFYEWTLNSKLSSSIHTYI